MGRKVEQLSHVEERLDTALDRLADPEMMLNAATLRLVEAEKELRDARAHERRARAAVARDRLERSRNQEL